MPHFIGLLFTPKDRKFFIVYTVLLTNIHIDVPVLRDRSSKHYQVFTPYCKYRYDLFKIGVYGRVHCLRKLFKRHTMHWDCYIRR